MERLLSEAYGIAGFPLEPMGGGRVNRLWRCGPWVVKLYSHQQVPVARAVQALRLQSELASRGIPAPQPARTRTGSLWAESPAGLVAVMPFMRGERRSRGRLTQAEAANLGRIIGRLHRALRSVQTGGLAAPTPPDPAALAARWAELKARAAARTAPDEFDEAVIRMADYVAGAVGEMDPVAWNLQPWQVCHRDLHLDNILFGGTGRIAALLDFDNASPWWSGADLMMAWNLSLCADPALRQLTPEGAAFFSAYRQIQRPAARAWADLPCLYWYALVSVTWPAPLRYRNGASAAPEWTEMLRLRLEAARWLQQNAEAMSRWLLA